eukprot:CAMPEP_0118985356 /NCGR_PEP_ID=MMETSP1173-20130426/39789_1 /TAXON_ID=1034831 /ORGANISM="Rhizochromulina marina cf, Strain CCMP1243" /LENGTH=279 /DNA_ID=CAMNT_0006936071 /DNA_START=402 /DNA_END=1242 /DNA_ORIENTATION=-
MTVRVCGSSSMGHCPTSSSPWGKHRATAPPLGRRVLRKGSARALQMVAPINGEAWAGDLDPSVDLREQGQLGREDFREEDHDEATSAVLQLPAEVGEDRRVALAPKSAEYDPPGSRSTSCLNGPVAQVFHFLDSVPLPGHHFTVGVVAVSDEVRVVDHRSLEMKPPVRHEHKDTSARAAIPFRAHKSRGCATKGLPRRQGFGLGHKHVGEAAVLLESGRGLVQRRTELNGPHEGQRLVLLGTKVRFDGGHEMVHVDSNLHKHVKRPHAAMITALPRSRG